jgi:hypothetical protein
MIVPQMFPDSPATVENRAALKARTRPKMATRKRIQTSESPKRSGLGAEFGVVCILLCSGYGEFWFQGSDLGLGFVPGRFPSWRMCSICGKCSTWNIH